MPSPKADVVASAAVAATVATPLATTTTTVTPSLGFFGTATTFDTIPVIKVRDGEDDNDSKDNDDIDDDPCLLRFVASFAADSGPLLSAVAANTEATTKESTDLATTLEAFLMAPEHLSFGRAVPSTILNNDDEMTRELVKEWTDACRHVGASKPDLLVGDRIVSVCTKGLSIPGLTVEWSALLGCKVVVPNVNHQNDGITNCKYYPPSFTSTTLPHLELVLIRDECQARGARPLVWIARKLLGTPNKKKGDENEKEEKRRRRETRFLTRLVFSNDKDNEKDGLILQCHGEMCMTFRMPRLLSRRLFATPQAKRQAEQKIEALISRQIQQDIQDSCLLEWENNYNRYISGA